MFLVPNIDQMYKEMKKIVEVGNKHGNGDEFVSYLEFVIFKSRLNKSLFKYFHRICLIFYLGQKKKICVFHKLFHMKYIGKYLNIVERLDP
jgi:hypothetical protein